MAKIAMKPGTMLNPVPAVMVTCGDSLAANIITIAWTGIINSDPPMTYVSVINLTTENLARATDFCGVKSGRDVNKAEETGLTLVAADYVSCPMIEQSPVNLECKVVEMKEYPTHDMFIAEIVGVHAEESLFDEKGKLCLDRAGLLCYSHGEYFGMKKAPLGRFGYSIMKAKTRKRINREKMEAKKKAGYRYGKKKKKG